MLKPKKWYTMDITSSLYIRENMSASFLVCNINVTLKRNMILEIIYVQKALKWLQNHHKYFDPLLQFDVISISMEDDTNLPLCPIWKRHRPSMELILIPVTKGFFYCKCGEIIPVDLKKKTF